VVHCKKSAHPPILRGEFSLRFNGTGSSYMHVCASVDRRNDKARAHHRSHKISVDVRTFLQCASNTRRVRSSCRNLHTLRPRSAWLSRPHPLPREGCKVSWWECPLVCLFVCLSVRSHNSQNHMAELHQIFTHVVCGRGSVLLGRHMYAMDAFLVRQIALDRSAPVLCRSFTTSERSTPLLMPDRTARTVRIFVGSYTGQRESCYGGVFKFLAPKR